MNIIFLHPCSAGVGRTGTFIILDNCLEKVKSSQHSKHNQQHQTAEDVAGPDCGMYCSSDHICTCICVFIHDAILEYLTCGDTQINAADL